MSIFLDYRLFLSGQISYHLHRGHIYCGHSLYLFTDCNANYSLEWRHNGRDGVSDHQPPDCLLNRLFRRRSKKTSKLRVTGLCPGNSPVTDEFPAQRASNVETVSIWWRHHVQLGPHVGVLAHQSPADCRDILGNSQNIFGPQHPFQLPNSFVRLHSAVLSAQCPQRLDNW